MKDYSRCVGVRRYAKPDARVWEDANFFYVSPGMKSKVGKVTLALQELTLEKKSISFDELLAKLCTAEYGYTESHKGHIITALRKMRNDGMIKTVKGKIVLL